MGEGESKPSVVLPSSQAGSVWGDRDTLGLSAVGVLTVREACLLGDDVGVSVGGSIMVGTVMFC